MTKSAIITHLKMRWFGTTAPLRDLGDVARKGLYRRQ
jgi:hypothetical protein